MATNSSEGHLARPDPQLTLVVPFWNVRSGGILRGSVRESVHAEASNVSMIIVDDHSDPYSASALSEAFSDLRNVRIVQTRSNCGPGGARNAGLDLVETDWVVFADADDDMDLPAYLDLVRLGSEAKVDVVAGSYRICLFGNRSRTLTEFREIPSSSLADAISRRAAVWRFAFRTEFLREQALRFPEMRYAEDLLFLLELACTHPRYVAIESATVTAYTAPESPRTPSGADFQHLLRRLSGLYRNASDAELKQVINVWRVRLAGHQFAHASERLHAVRYILTSLMPDSPGALASLVRAFGRVASELLLDPPVMLRNRTLL